MIQQCGDPRQVYIIAQVVLGMVADLFGIDDPEVRDRMCAFIQNELDLEDASATLH